MSIFDKFYFADVHAKILKEGRIHPSFPQIRPCPGGDS